MNEVNRMTATFGYQAIGRVVSLEWRRVNPHSILRDFDRWFAFERIVQGL